MRQCQPEMSPLRTRKYHVYMAVVSVDGLTQVRKNVGVAVQHVPPPSGEDPPVPPTPKARYTKAEYAAMRKEEAMLVLGPSLLSTPATSERRLAGVGELRPAEGVLSAQRLPTLNCLSVFSERIFGQPAPWTTVSFTLGLSRHNEQ